MPWKELSVMSQRSEFIKEAGMTKRQVSSQCVCGGYSLPASGEGVDYCYRGKSLLPKLPAKLKDEFSSLGDFGVRS